MKKEWWPEHLSHIPNEKPWEADHVVVAEVRSFDEAPHAGQRITSSALVPVDQMSAIEKNLAGFGHEVQCSGPHPFYRTGTSYVPKFWIEAVDLPSKSYEPLVLSWHSHDKTVLVPDPGFLMTYGLMPRNTAGGGVSWDDPAKPSHDVVIVSPPAVWDFPLSTTAMVSISKEHLADYLTLRGMVLVQAFWEIRWGNTDATLEMHLGDSESVEITAADRKFQLNRDLQDKKVIAAQVWGARIVAGPGELPITENDLEKEGLVWPGFSQPVTDSMAEAMRMTDMVYVRDSVLAAFEGKAEFRIHPKSGAVTFGTQWSVGFCDRLGRDLIGLELKKLYEGVPPHITRHWNRFAVPAPPDSAYPAIKEERNIAIRAEQLTFALISLGEKLSALATSVRMTDAMPEDFVGLRKQALEYSGWWTFPEIEIISRHVPLDCAADSFLDRCLNLHKLLVEGLSESKLRGLLIKIGVPADSIADFATLKLLDCLVRMAQKAIATGLSIREHGKQVWARLEKEGTEPARPITYLFALHDIRVLKAHKAGDQRKELTQALERYGIGTGDETPGYGRILDKIYDLLIELLHGVAGKLAAAS